MTKSNPFRYFKTSPEIIRLAVMMYVRFPLSLRNVEDLLHERGRYFSRNCKILVEPFWPHVRCKYSQKTCPAVTGLLQLEVAFGRQRCPAGYCIAITERVFVKINGETHYLWRAVDHEGEVLEAIVTKKRDKRAALKLLRKLMRRYGYPDTVVTDKLKSYGAAFRELGISCHENMGRWINNRCENLHLPFRRRERAMQRFRQMRSLQKFVSIHSSIYNQPLDGAALACRPAL